MQIADDELAERKARRDKKISLKEKKEKTGGWREGLEDAGKEFREQAKKERRARVAALYSDLRIAYDTGSLSGPTIKDYLKDFPSGAEYQAFEEISELVHQGKIDKEVQKLRTKIKTSVKSLRHEKVSSRERAAQERKKMLEEAVRDRVGRAGPPKNPETGESFFSAEEWREALLREYVAGRLNEEDLQHFFIYYSADKKEAYEKLAEEEGINLRESGEKFDWDEIGDRILMSAGFRKEFIKDIPTEEGKTIFEEMLNEQIDAFKQILRDTISREEREKKIAELSGDEEKADKELVAEAAKKFLAVRELFTHGVLRYDGKSGKMILKQESDLDGECAAALFDKAGINKKITEYLKPGEYRKGQTTVDSGNADGLLQEWVEAVDPETDEKKMEITTVIDHHGPYSGRGTSATAAVYKVFTELGLLKFEDEKEKKNYDKVVEWVTHSDNFSFPGVENYFDSSNNRMIGFLKFAKFDKLLEFAKSGKDITEILSAGELKKYGFYSEQRDKIIREAKRQIDGLAPEVRVKDPETKKEKKIRTGWVVATGSGLFLVDTRKRSENKLENQARGELQWAAASAGFAGIIRYNTETHGFSVALNKGEFDPKIFKGLPQGKLVRKSMFLQPEGREKLVIGLGDLINRLSPGFEPGPQQAELKKFLEEEPWRIRTIVSRAPEGYWWTNAPDGTKVIVFDRDIPKNFKSGREAYIRLTFYKPQQADNKQRREYGVSEFYIGRLEPDEIVLPKKPEVKKSSVKTEAAPAKPEIKKPEVKKETPAKIEIKKPAAPEVKAASSAKPEIKPPVPKTETKRTPEEVKEIEATIAFGKEKFRKNIFEERMQKLEKDAVWGKRDERERREIARRQTAELEPEVVSFEQSERKKYGI